MPAYWLLFEFLKTTAKIADHHLIMSTEAETTTINSQPEQQAPLKAQPSKKEKKRGKEYLPLEHFL